MRTIHIVVTGALLAAIGLAAPAYATATPLASHGSGGSKHGALWGAPKPGTCYDVPGRYAAKPSLAAHTVGCRHRHTMWVVAAAKIPARYAAAVVNGHPLAGKSAKIFYRICNPAVARAAGGFDTGFARSAYGYYYFVPTKAQQKAGAHWLSCTMGIFDAKNLVTTSKAKPAKIGKRIPDALQLCGTKGYLGTTCRATHVYRQSYAYTVRHRLTQTGLQKSVHRVCPSHVASSTWMYYRREITLKDNLVTCLTKTRR